MHLGEGGRLAAGPAAAGTPPGGEAVNPPVPAGDQASDEDLVRRACQGDHEAFADLVRRHHGLVYNLCLRLVGQPADAADATQEVFLRVFTRLAHFRGQARFRTWLYRIAVNTCQDELRRRRRRPWPWGDLHGDLHPGSTRRRGAGLGPGPDPAEGPGTEASAGGVGDEPGPAGEPGRPPGGRGATAAPAEARGTGAGAGAAGAGATPGPGGGGTRTGSSALPGGSGGRGEGAGRYPARFPDAFASGSSPEAAVLAGEIRQAVASALAGLPEPFRVAVVLRDLHDLSYEEIGAVLGLPPGTVRSRIHRGRLLLRDALIRAGWAPGTGGEMP
ncbi:sigma-70 family RNA polymerase sigma factor [Thermaerobacter sp. PB12/4term]|uniref:RNA polymerase sigma factor n=1 Tax=Thermaerobacter sp. PB12/4term TaxID=2293838 RepID=UPI00131476BF|nr:sigma-70 family RNA polymerase sigma factor [Thermaerobacter sp. PB12/4term]QIA26442.1 sigma-70 family RNA polymerase sigma factor [Thermaerobacter sp. PB12/4term]